MPSAPASSGISVFEPARFERVHKIINEAASNPVRLSRSNEWYVAIDRNRSELADLGKVKPPSEAERKEIESGKINVDGNTQSLNSDFAQQSLLLARELHVSEYYAASLLQQGLAGRARWGRPAVEVACLLYHRERLALLACLKHLARNALTLPFEDDPEAQRMGTKMEQLLESLVFIETSVGQQASQPKINLPERLLVEIDTVKQSALRVKTSLESPNPASVSQAISTHTSSFLGLGSHSNAPSSSTASGGRLSDEIQLDRLGWLREERRELGHILYLLSISSLLSTSNISALLRWLASATAESYDEMTIYILTALFGAIDANPDARLVMAKRASRGTLRTTIETLLDDESFLSSVHTEITKKKWAMGELNSAVALQWSVFLVESFSRNPTFRSQLSISEDAIQDLVLQSITGSSFSKDGKTNTDSPTGGAFVFLVVRILAFRQKTLDVLYGGEEEASAGIDAAAEMSDSNTWEEEVDIEFRDYVVQQIQSLILGVVSIMLPMLRRLQRSEEDAAFALSRGPTARASVALPKERRYDVEALFDLIALLCRGRPESALSFWVGPDNRTTRFLAWAIDVREPGHQRALLNMLAAMSSGPQSASQAYALLDQESQQGGSDARLVSWSRFFEWISYYVDTFHQAMSSNGLNVSHHHALAMPKNEETLLIGFVRLFRNVIYFSGPARDALLQNSTYNALDKLFSLLTCPVPVELKASILDALSAFVYNASAQASQFSSIAAQLWTRLDACGLIPAESASESRTDPSASAFGPAFRPMASKGMPYELESYEAPLRTFPGSTSFVKFLSALVQLPPPTPSNANGLLSMQVSSTAPQPFGAIVSFDPQTLQQSQNSQLKKSYSVEPYVDFVIDQVFLKARTREYAEPAEQWRVVSSCLDFIDRSLRSYDLSALLNDANNSTALSDPAILTQLATHSGFFLMKRLLTGSNFAGELLGILVPGSGLAAFEAINQNRASTLFYGSSVRHILSILEQLLRNQDLFVQVLMPSLLDAVSGGIQLPFDVPSRIGHSGAYTSFDMHLLHAHESVVQIALLINCIRDDIALLSVRLLSLIARTSAFTAVDRFGEMGYRRKMNRLVGLLEMSDEAGRVRAGYVGRLEAEPSVDANPKTTESLLAFGSGADLEDPELQVASGIGGDAVEAIQIAILNLFLTSTELEQPAPNVAHLLLGYDLRAVHPEEQVITDPDAQASAPSAIHAILASLRHGENGSGTALLSLAEHSPGFAEKCYALILRLCTHPFTSAATLRYLRTKEDFVVKQLQHLSLSPAERATVTSNLAALGIVQYTDGRMLETSIDRVVASLRLRASLLDLAALELHSLLNTGMQARAARVITALFGPNSTLGGNDANEDTDDDGFFLKTERDFRLGTGGADGRTFGGVRFLEMLQSLDFEWYDDREALGQDIDIITPEQLESAKLPDAASGPRMFDLKAVVAVLLGEKIKFQQRGSMRESAQIESFLEQSSLVLQWVSAQNAKRAVVFSRRKVLQAWRHTLDMVLARATDLLRIEIRAGLMFDCLSELLPRIAAPSNDANGDPASADLVAGAVLSLLTSLRQHRVEMAAGTLELDAADALPVDRLIVILRSLVDSILRLETTTLARGNLYSALVNFLQLVRQNDTEASSSFNEGASFTTHEIDDSMSIDGFSTTTSFGARSQSSSLEARTKALLLSHAERLVDVLGRDALDASDLSKTISFTLLDMLCALDSPSTSSLSRRGGSKCLEFLDRKGYIKSFVVALRDSDLALQETLRPDPDSLNAIYVYEARMSFFSRIAQTRDGAEKLLSAKIFDVLSQSDYLAARPDQDQDFVDLDSFLPAATERYQALLTPVLQLSTSILASTSLSTLNSVSTQKNSYGLGKALASTSSHAAPRHALALLTSHRDAFLNILQVPVQDYCSFVQLSQAHLVVTIFTLVMPILDDDAQLPPNPLAPFHTAIIALAAAYIHSISWKLRIIPTNDAEREEARLPSASARALRATGDGNSAGAGAEDETAFEAKAGSVVVRLQMALLAYLEGASDARGDVPSRVRPVLAPSLIAYRERSRTPYGAYNDGDEDHSTVSYLRAQRASAAASTVPSLGTLVSALEDYTDSVAKELRGLDHIDSILENTETIRQDEFDEVVRDILKEDILGDMPPAHRKSVAIRELNSRRASLRASSTSKLDAIELCLVLLIRHIEFFASLEDAVDLTRAQSLLSNRSQKTGASSNLALQFDKTTLMHGLAEVLLPIVEEKIGYLSLPPNLVVNARERQSFLQMAGRRLAHFFSNE